ncbi:FtsX-like permease family protein [Bacillus sp. Marseille-P3661]|uniref:FtsX-like permease family protein n=1 Tax=Bacillus sp. Marseille-P3661 TaxID=1936234 RepID=UPI002155847C|nr:FtsX-like permease family protein [Bacillus sp. Marseille-P3661]
MRRKMRTFLTIMAIMIGVASTFGVMAAVDTAEKAFPIYLKEAVAKADFTIASTDAYFSEDVHKQISQSKNYSTVAMLKENAGFVTKEKGISAIQKRVVITGYSELGTSVTDFKVIEGNLKANGAVITDRTAKVWGADLGENISFDTDRGVKEIEVTAIVRYTKELMGPSSWNMAKYHHWAVALPLPVVQDWFDQHGNIQMIQVKADNPNQLDDVEHELAHLVKSHTELFLQPIVVNFDTEFKDLNTFFLALYIAGFLGIALSAFIILNSLYVSVKERRNEFAVLKTIGYTPRQLQAMVLTEVTLVAIIGTVAGLIAGYALGHGLKQLIFMVYGVESSSSMVLATGLLVSAVAGLLVPILAAWYPIQQVGKVSVIEVLKENKAESQGTNKWLGIVGVLLIFSSFFIKHLLLVLPLMIGIVLLFPYLFKLFSLLLKGFYGLVFKFSGELAIRNLNRNISRTSITSVILCLGIAMIVLMSSLNSALLQSYESAIHKNYGGNLDIMFHHIEKEDLDTIKNIEGVADATTYSLQGIIWNMDGEKRLLPIFGVGAEWIDSFQLFTVSSGSHSELIKNLKSDEIILDETSFKAWGGKIGDSISLETLEGEKSFKVADVVYTMKNSGYSAFMHEDHFRKNFGVKFERNALVIKDEQTSPLQLRENIYDQFGERIEEMWGPEDWASMVGSTITGAFSIVNVLVILGIIVSGIGITNTLMINILERVREIAMMRAVGVTRSQIIKMIVLEGFGIGLSATTIGILFGILLIYLTSGFVEVNSLTFEFGVSPLILSIIFLFGILLSLIASFTPSRRAAKTKLNGALRYE